jgi:hypothetical protein
MAEDKVAIIRELSNLIVQIQEKSKCVGITIDNSEDIKIGTYTSKGYSKAAEIKNSRKIEIGLIDSTAPSDLQNICPILERAHRVRTEKIKCASSGKILFSSTCVSHVNVDS